jgi:hypothetical protein
MISAFAGPKKSYSQFGSDLRAARGMLSLVAGLREFFREPVTPEKAKEEIRRAVEFREQTFLDLVRTQVYDREGSPYLKLLRMAGCDFADLQTHICRHGLEKTLEKLAKEGVYLTQDEFKGKKEVVRGTRSFTVSRKDLQLQDADRGLILTQSSGTRGQPQRHALSLDRLAATSSLSTAIFFSAHDLFSYSHAIYDAILPTTGGIRYLLRFAKNGIKVDRWFAREVPMNSWPEAAFHHLTTSLIVLATKFFGPGSPWPEFLDGQEVGRIVNWIAEKKQVGKACCVRTTASNAVRIARTAQTMGQSLDGAKFVVSGEPLTESKRAFIEKLGGHAIPCYGCAGLNQIAYGCGNPRHTDDLHVSLDILAVIQQPRPLDANGLAIHPFLFTTLSPLSPLLHINVENGDFGVIEARECGCALEKAGFRLHLHHIRSFEKLTGEGMSYYYGDLFDLLEKTFPSEFGGGPGDYQLAEEEDGNGQTRLTLVVHPAVGNLDEGKILARLRAALADGSRTNRFTTWVWQDAGTFRVKREPPYVSPRGKILPLHISQAKTKLPGTKALSAGVR